jgi:hypothetical protein
MIRLTVSISFVAALLLACGSGDSTSGGGTAPVSAAGTQAAAKTPAAAPSAAANEEPDPQAISCLDLVAKGRFQQAIAPCVAAVKANPADAELKAALTEAQSQAKALADAGQAAAADGAEAAGRDAAGNAAKGATDKLEY